QEAVVSRIKVLSDMKIDEKRIPQDGRFNFKVDKEEVDLRVSSLPTVHGEKIVMRLLKKSGGVPTLQELGIRGTALKNLEAASIVPHGIVLVTGPTGSGKTTTLYSLLTKINSPKVNIVTLEDPVEYQMAGINQVQINPQAGLTFASGLRAFLRQDPNIIMVGEIRDQETAELAIQAALTGHVVFSTLHTNSAAGALPRLLDMKAEPFLLVSSMTLVMAQRVVRKICLDCKEEYEPEQVVIDDMKNVLGGLFDGWAKQNSAEGGNIKLHRGKGCDECGGTGYKGRIGVYEVLVMNEKIGRLILERRPAEDIEKQSTEDGMVLMKQDGYLKVLEGITTIEEVLRVVSE
ncbi:MAG: GspE/PulE family protein, partial [Patescibacteria group bacterium]